MVIISYDIHNDKLRTQFAKQISSKGAIRLQYSVYEVRNTKRIIENIKIIIEDFAKQFTPDDSVVIFDVDDDKLTKYGRAIHRDQPIVYF